MISVYFVRYLLVKDADFFMYKIMYFHIIIIIFLLKGDNCRNNHSIKLQRSVTNNEF